MNQITPTYVRSVGDLKMPLSINVIQWVQSDEHMDCWLGSSPFIDTSTHLPCQNK